MGLLDSLTSGSRGGYGGLLDMLMYQSPLYQGQQPQPDTMAGLMPPAPSNQWTQPNPFDQAPPVVPPAPPSVFNAGAAPVAGLSGGAPPTPAQAVPALPPAQTVGPAPQPDPSPSIKIGDYRMPQMGAMADYTPVGGATDVSAQSRQPQAMPPAPQQSQTSFGDNLMAGLNNLNSGGNPITMLANVASGLATGQRYDKAGIAQQNIKAKYDAFRAEGLTQTQAMLAAMDPKASEIAVQRILEKKQYGFTKADDGSIIANDPSSGKSFVSYGGGGNTSAGVAGPDGKMIPYPEGLDAAGRKTFANEIARINADAASGKKTEVQAKSEKFGNRMEMAEKNLRGLDVEGTSLTNRGLEALPGGVGNLAQSEKFQKFKQARSAFIQAMLRDESGAAIQTPEFTRLEREMFPQPGDTPDVISQKAEARKVAIEAMKKSAGPGYKSPEAAPKGPSRADIEAEIRRRGLMK